MSDPRADLRRIYDAGVFRVRGYEVVQAYPAELKHCHGDPEFERDVLSHDLHLVAIGKAAVAMAAGFHWHIEQSETNAKIIDGLVITKHGHAEKPPAWGKHIECIESDHPVPGDNTLRAGKRLLAYLSEHAKGNARFLFLLSGGASSLVEVLPKGMRLDDLRTLTGQLLAGGLDIGRMNRVRRALSGIKGGRLAKYLNECPTLNWVISDVPGDDLGTIGSGLLTPVRETVNPEDYPDAVRALLERVERVPVPDDAAFEMIRSRIIACLDDAKTACGEAGKKLYKVRRPEPAFVEGDVKNVAEALYRELMASRDEVLIWGGEPTVKLPDNPGRGGRNQQLALAVALKIRSEVGTYFLSAGTDGTDGPTDDAGAVVDGATIERGEKEGFDAEDCLRRADAGTFLEASGDLITTGPTGTNVMDLMLGFRQSGKD